MHYHYHNTCIPQPGDENYIPSDSSSSSECWTSGAFTPDLVQFEAADDMLNK